MKKNIRIDPLTDYGVVDIEFLDSDDYKYESQAVKRYISLEGFDEEKKEFKLRLNDRDWWVNIN
jgi:hypothetical protein